MLAKRVVVQLAVLRGVWLGVLLGLIPALGVSLHAQDTPATDVSPGLHLTGVVHTDEAVPIPGATIRAVQTTTGQAWVSWTDDNGKFEFPALPPGHYRVQLSQIGFAPATSEVDLAQASQSPLDLKLNIGTLAAITAPPAQTPNAAPPNAASSNSAPPNAASAAAGQSPTAGAAPATPPANAPANAATSASSGAPSGTTAANNGAASSQRRGTGGQGTARNGQGGTRRTFQQVQVNGQNQDQTQNQNQLQTNPDESSIPEDQGMPEAGGQLGGAGSADAVPMIGTIAMGQTPDQVGGGLGQLGTGGQDGLNTQGFGNNPTIPGQAPTGGQGGPGGPAFVGGGPGGGGPGGPGGPGGGGFGGPGGGRGPGGPRGAPRGPQGVNALMGAQRIMRQRINRVHYSIYDTFGDAALNSRPYSLNQANAPKISGWTESAGVNIGGPLKIPHIYDGTDKTFFYINYGGTWARTPVDSFSTVPTLAEKMGDFSAENVQLYNPFSNLTGPRTLISNAGCAADAANAPGTCIPTNMISQQSTELLNYIPMPNVPCSSSGVCPTLNYHLQTNIPGVSNRLNANVTHQISSKLSLQVNYNLSNSTAHTLASFPGLEANVFSRGQSLMIGLTQNYTKTFVHTSQLYFSRSRGLGLNAFSFLTNISSQLGITGVSTNPFDFGLPAINLTDFTGLSNPNPYLNRSQTYRYVDSFRWIKAKHTISAGGEVRRMDIDKDSDPTPNGQFAFTGLMTSQLTSAGTPVTSPTGCGPLNPAMPCIGSDFADFLLGLPANTKVQYGDTSTYFHNWGFVGYGTDDWHMRPHFTLTYGLRYEAFTPPTEVDNRIANLEVGDNFTQVQCVTPVAISGCAAGPTHSLFYGHYNNWAPRIGIAWQPPGRWFTGKHQLTVRAGYSMFYVESYLNTLSNEMANQPPFALANTLVTLVSSSAPLTLQNGLTGTSTNTATNTVAVDPHYKVPYAEIWNASIEYNLLRDTFVEIMYTGTRGIHLDELLGYSLASTGTGATTHAAGFTYDTSGAISNFNAVQVRLQKRMSHGFLFMARYTYSKSLDDASTIGGGAQTVIQNNACPRCDYGLSSFNMTHQFLANFTYQLPFGDRQRFARRGWQKSVFGAFRVNGTFTAHSGTPFTIRDFSTNPSCQNVPGVNSERADLVGNSALANPTVQEWFNTAAYATPTGCFGDAPRNSLIGPAAFTMNAGISKTVQFGRDGLRRLDFTWNTTNLLNHVNYAGLSTVLGSPTFGQVTSVGPMRSMTFTTRVNF